MLTIDAHQHFWKFNPIRDSWINDEMSVIQKDFLPEDLHPLLQENNIDGCVAVQSNQSEEENIFQLANAEKFDFIKGVVGWVDLQAENIEERLEYYSGFKKLVGFRHILQGEAQRDYMLQPAFMRGVNLLNKYNFTYDILILPDQLKYAIDFVKAFPNQPFVIDHLAKPDIKYNTPGNWKSDMTAIAKCENVYCKVSGMVTEADWKNWKPSDFTPFLNVVTEAFGTDRLLFGSDWPVCLVAASYSAAFQVVENYFSSFSPLEKAKVFGANATRFYKLAK